MGVGLTRKSLTKPAGPLGPDPGALRLPSWRLALFGTLARLLLARLARVRGPPGGEAGNAPPHARGKNTPDGTARISPRYLSSRRLDRGVGEVWLLPVPPSGAKGAREGGEPVRLGDAPTSVLDQPVLTPDGRCAVVTGRWFGPKGCSLLFTYRLVREPSGAVSSAGSAGAEAGAWWTDPAEICAFGSPAFSPDGRRLAVPVPGPASAEQPSTAEPSRAPAPAGPPGAGRSFPYSPSPRRLTMSGWWRSATWPGLRTAVTLPGRGSCRHRTA